MSTVTCYECGKKYSYEEDGFCPKCGSFNQPRKGSYTVAENGDIVRVDGINEAVHKNSFVHAEYHAEERERKKLGLDRERPKPQSRVQSESQRAVVRQQMKSAAKKKQNPAGTGFMIVWIIIVLSMIFSVLGDIM